MQILLNSDPNVNGGHLMAEHLKQVVTDAMGRFGEHITRVEAHVSDANSSAKSGANDIHCTLEARLVGLDPLVVKDHAGNAHQAIDGAVRKLKRAVETALAKHDDPRRRTASARPGDAAGQDTQEG
jgi:ribosome-associated translation inhibitor RaiA